MKTSILSVFSLRRLFSALGFGAWAISTTTALAQSGLQDPAFNAAVATGPSGYSVIAQPDGKVIAAGTFGVARLLKDGSMDPTFHTPLIFAVDAPSSSGQRWIHIALQPDGKILVSGNFTNAAGDSFRELNRLQADGSIDPSFNLDSLVHPSGAMVLQPDGKIVSAGSYHDPVTDDYGGLFRLRADGSLDPDFDVHALDQLGEISRLALASDGMIYYLSRGEFGRLNTDGTLDGSFQGGSEGAPFGAMALQPDGKLLIGGYSDGDNYSPLRRLLLDGSSDPDWTSPRLSGGDAQIQSILVQPDGKVLAGGNNLMAFDGIFTANLGRVNADGSVDPTFDTRGDLYFYEVQDMALAPDGKVLVAGYQIYRPDFLPRPGVWELTNDTSLRPDLEIAFTAGQRISLRVRGPVGSNYRVEFQDSVSGGSWTLLGNLTLTQGEATIEDRDWASAKSRFYRAVSLP